METIESIEKRRSVRKFTDQPIEWEKIGNILHAGQLAPSSGNIQDWRFVVVTDKATRQALANSALKQHWIATAPVIIVVYSEPKSTQRYYGLRGEKLYTIQNCAAAVENMLLAATDQGLGSCWIGAFDETMINHALGAPENVRPQAMIPVGYTEENPDAPKRYKLIDITYINKWGGKFVNMDLVLDDFSEAMRKKLREAKEEAYEKGPIIAKGIAEKGKNKIKEIHSKIKQKLDERKKKKEDKLEEELGGEEEVLEDSESF